MFAAVRDYFQMDAALLGQRGDGHIARAAAAWLSRRVTTATLRELSVPLGLTRPESVSHLTRRMERVLSRDPKLKRDLTRLEFELAQNTKNKA